jgi:putative N6-adenine-specific DNA methylase
MMHKTFCFEEILAKELQNLGAQNVEQGVRMVSFEGDKGLCTS